MTHYAIVGGAGFIGSHFVDILASQGNEISVIDNFCSGSESRILTHINKPYFKMVKANAEDTEVLVKAFRSVETVIHLASNPDIAKAATDPRIDFTQGTALTESVLEASRRSGVKNFLYASGSGVYASSGLNPIKEDSKLQPISTYGASKLAGESLSSAYAFMFGIKCLAFRFANVVGPKQTHGVGFDFLRKLRINPAELEVMGNGTQTKSYIDVLDVVSGVLTANNNIDTGFEVFNVATEDVITVKEIAELALEIANLSSETTKIKYGESDRGWKADVPQIALNSERLRSLGWSNKFNSREAMRNALIAMNKN